LGVSNVRVRLLTILLLVLAALLVLISIIYFTRTASDLPSLFPGHSAHSSRHHIKHGIAALGLAAVLVIAAWFTTAPKRETT
jgi:hypothetical protein